MERFVSREDALSRLRRCYDSDNAEMVVIFGRRRLGKTQLVQHSLAECDDGVSRFDPSPSTAPEY
ncbi:hypothetical protein C491_17819 [Natronococcus amylolyticus DSM 10524]|uniref:ATPase domain-containing protein n=1 Tax=Natronococcus amylolyticus DSM 10524 TaxID=1227497 RepID=L9WZR7_9EURY|nr:hypothetical protein C491_17819 [Natronococcus amylolyticus DSM 10524]